METNGIASVAQKTAQDHRFSQNSIQVHPREVRILHGPLKMNVSKQGLEIFGNVLGRFYVNRQSCLLRYQGISSGHTNMTSGDRQENV